MDADERVFRAFGFNYQPNTVFITREGDILERIVGPIDRDRLDRTIDRLLEA